MYKILNNSQKNCLDLYKWHNSTLIFLKHISLPQNIIYAISSKWLVCYSKKKIYKLNLEQNKNEIEKSHCKHEITTIFLKDNICLIGGYGVFIKFDLIMNNFEKLEIPKHIERKKKSIDHIILEESIIYVVDNVIQPKWLLVYKESPYNQFNLIYVKNIPSNGTHENYINALILDKYIILLSQCVSRDFNAQYISILNKFNCEVIGVIEDVLRQNPRFQITNEKLKNKISHNSNVNISKKQTYKMLLENEYKKNHELTQKPEWINIYTFKNNLIILNSENRIGKLDLSKILEKRKSNIDANQIDWDIYNFEIDELVCIKKDIYYYHKLNDDKLNWNILEI